MTDPEDIQRLIRLKRYEQPPEDFMEDFMLQLHQRQRSDMLQQSSVSLLWERMMMFFEGRSTSNMALAGAAALVMVGSVAWWVPNHGSESVVAQQGKGSRGAITPASMATRLDSDWFVSPQFEFADQETPTPTPGRLGNELLSQHFNGGYADEARSPNLSKASYIAPDAPEFTGAAPVAK